jgi:hypothetical protein
MGPALLATTVNGDVGDEMACQPQRAKAFWRSPVLGTLVLSEIVLVREGLETDVHHPDSRRIFGALRHAHPLN